MWSLIMLVEDIIFRKSEPDTLEVLCKKWDANPRISIQFLLLGRISPKFRQPNNLPFSDNILLGITAIAENTAILIALHKETSLHQPSKVLLRNLVAGDLCVGFAQIAYGVELISILQGRWQTCRLLFLILGIACNISITVSLSTITAISVDRLLALLLKLRYRQVVTIRKVNAVAIFSWVCNGTSNALLWYFSPNSWIVFLGTNVAVCLATSTYCYIRIFFQAASPTNSSPY